AVSIEEILELRAAAQHVFIDEILRHWIVELVRAPRNLAPVPVRASLCARRSRLHRGDPAPLDRGARPGYAEPRLGRDGRLGTRQPRARTGHPRLGAARRTGLRRPGRHRAAVPPADPAPARIRLQLPGPRAHDGLAAG